MSVSKRARFEVLRRDNHACRYCGATAPDVKLHVDHVIPVALGGTDDPANLVTACADCNSGKTSVPADVPLVDDVKAHENDFRQRLKASLEDQTQRIIAQEDENAGLLEQFVDYWCDNVSHADTYPAKLETSVARWLDMGVPIALITYAMDTVAANAASYWDTDRKWKYTCGIVWRRIEQAADEAMSGIH